MNDIHTRLYTEGPLPINEELAGLVPMATHSEQAALTNDIRTNGLREPIITYKGAVVDGRCRMKALRLLKQPILYKELDSSLSIEDVAIYVKSVNTRRNLTRTQKIAAACKVSLQDKKAGTLKEIATSWGISERALNSMRYIAKHRPDYLEELFNGNDVDVRYKGTIISTDSVTTIARAVKLELEANNLTTTAMATEWNPDSMIKTEAGKQWYAKEIEIAREDPIRYMIELANLLYKLNE